LAALLDPATGEISTLRISGRPAEAVVDLRQDALAEEMLFLVEAVIAYVSRVFAAQIPGRQLAGDLLYLLRGSKHHRRQNSVPNSSGYTEKVLHEFGLAT
jgi:hypothetical protein